MYDDDMGRDPQTLLRSYPFLRKGKLPQTSQINAAQYVEFFVCIEWTCRAGPMCPALCFAILRLTCRTLAIRWKSRYTYLDDFIGLKGDSR